MHWLSIIDDLRGRFEKVDVGVGDEDGGWREILRHYIELGEWHRCCVQRDKNSKVVDKTIICA